MVSVPFTLSPTTCSMHPKSLEKKFTHVFLCLLRLIGCLYSSDSPVLSLMIEFAVIFRYMWYDMPSGVFWYWDTIISGHTLLYTFLNHFYVWWGICALVGGRSLPVPFPPLVVNTHFLQYGMWWRGMVVLHLSIFLVWVIRDSGMVTACLSTLGGGWVLFFFYSTILVYVLVV